ncbi:type I restriction enzyme HsdR N-terminal domain-containing protein [Haloarchaeobius amylolyticus]|uniref:type I restriction enzyme HsdR N-terminal domain-containing protein n=1 Tax=Haloarchaeobius amylolyticus TaxID=1198296 RepID=UPI00226D7221|nr:type I restriction enzyme HsdR N-terminal domain-containing protein [Haloarchaeobius amylolyticus]
MGPADLTEYVEHATEVVATSPELGLRNTQLRLVEPFLEALGWNVRAPEVEAAFHVPGAEATVDYALLADGRPTVFVFTRPAEESLGTDDTDQLSEAMRAAGVSWGVLTNGRQFAFAGSKDGETEWAECDLQGLPERSTVLEHYTRARAIERARTRTRAERETAAERLEDAGDELVEALTTELQAATDGAAAADLETATREFVQRLVQSFRSDDGTGSRPTGTPRDGTEAGPAGVSDAAEVEAETEDTETSVEPAQESVDDAASASDRQDGVQTVAAASAGGDGEFVARFFRDRTSVGAVGCSTVEGAMGQIVDYLVEQHHLAGSISLPYCPDEDETAVLHREPVHPDGRPMRPAVELESGPFLWTGGDLETQRARLEDLASRAGLRVMFQGDWRTR